MQPDEVEAAYNLVHLGPPTTREAKRASEFLPRYENALKEPDMATNRMRALQALCRVLLSSNEFVHVM